MMQMTIYQSLMAIGKVSGQYQVIFSPPFYVEARYVPNKHIRADAQTTRAAYSKRYNYQGKCYDFVAMHVKT